MRFRIPDSLSIPFLLNLARQSDANIISDVPGGLENSVATEFSNALPDYSG
jgi:hypothetical protein